MSSMDFEAALNAPDCDESRIQLRQLCSKCISGRNLGIVAEKYLDAFCEDKSPMLRRRWVGLVLRKMMESSADVIEYLISLNNLSRLGQVILSKDELEETKIVAGLILRQGLEQGIDFESFWPSKKVVKKKPAFPSNAVAKWMAEFQAFLDTLGGLSPTNPLSDPAILYTISLVSSDGYKWRDPSDVAAITLIQGELLTVITSDAKLQDMKFIDVPVTHIQTMHLEKATLHDSQERATEHEPWDLVLNLRPGPWTYRINTKKYRGHKLSLLFASRSDVEECESCIKELKTECGERHHDRTSRLVMFSSDAIDVSQSSERNPTNVNDCSRLESTQQMINDAEEAMNGNVDLTITVDASTTSKKGLRSSNPRTPISARDKATRVNYAVSGEPAQRPSIEWPSSDRQLLKPTHVEYCESSTNNQVEDEPSVNTVRAKGAQKPLAGTLPTIKKKVRLSQAKLTPTHVIGDIFEFPGFPDQSPRMKRPSNPKRAPNSKTKSTINALSKKVTKAKSMGIKPKADLRQQANDTEDEEDPLSSQLPQLLGKAKEHSEDTQAILPLAKEPNMEQVGVRRHEKASGLPKVSKLPPKPQRTTTDVFAIPQTRRKVVKPLNYDSSNVDSEDESSVSEYTEGAKRMGSSARTARPPKAASYKQASKASSAKIAVAKHSNPSTTNKQPLPSKRRPLLNSPHSRSQPTSSVKSNQSMVASKSARLKDQEPKPVVEDGPFVSAQRQENALLSSEIHILDRLNESDNDIESPNMPEKNPKQLITQSKRTAESSPPSTPKLKRVKVNHERMQSSQQQGDNAFVRPPETFAPLRVLDEHSSPCKRQETSQQMKRLSALAQAPTRQNALGSSLPMPMDQRQHKLCVSDRKFDRRQTPRHQQNQRSCSGGSANLELLSSNSKPLPASPHAESTAISGYADCDLVGFEKEFGEHETASSDPFIRRMKDQKLNAFTRRLADLGPTAIDPELEPEEDLSNSMSFSFEYRESPEANNRVISRLQRIPVKLQRKTTSPIKINKSTEHEHVPTLEPPKKVAVEDKVVELESPLRNAPPQVVDPTQPASQYRGDGDIDMERDTLVAFEEEQITDMKASPLHYQSSPPFPGSPSSHSSTSAEHDSETGVSVPTLEAEEMEWEASLQPHQRSLHELLLRISKRVVRRIVDSETAVSDIVETYERDGEHLLRSLLDRHDGFAAIFKGMEKKRGVMRQKFNAVAKRLAKEREWFKQEETRSRTRPGETEPIRY